MLKGGAPRFTPIGAPMGTLAQSLILLACGAPNSPAHSLCTDQVTQCLNRWEDRVYEDAWADKVNLDTCVQDARLLSTVAPKLNHSNLSKWCHSGTTLADRPGPTVAPKLNDSSLPKPSHPSSDGDPLPPSARGPTPLAVLPSDQFSRRLRAIILDL